MTNKRWLWIITGLVLLVAAGLIFFFIPNPAFDKTKPAFATPTATVEPFSQPAFSFDDPTWWDHAVFYEIFVRSYADSNGDGIGDFNGITSKLDYLNDGDPATTTDLGINAIWLMPIYPSPSYHGYDVTDYFTVNPEYGTLDDFKTLLAEAHKRGIHVILDFVINHTSTQHPWFVASQDPASEFRSWYIWRDDNPGYKGPWGEDVWHAGKNGGFYYGIFWEGMPDLNMQNPAVVDEIEKAASFWINDIGVDGFRVDGAKHLIEDGKVQQNTPATIAWFKDFSTLYKSWNPKVMTVGEVWDSSSITNIYLKANSFDLVFNFDLASGILSGVKSGSTTSLSSKVFNEVSQYSEGGMAGFLANHDMDRVLSQLGGDFKKAGHAATILLTMPGTPFIYYGEEIGMLGKKPDEQIRTPMQWNGEQGGGFSTGTPWEALNSSYTKINVATQDGDNTSLLSLYRDLIHIRVNHPALITGKYGKVEVAEKDVFAFLRIGGEETTLTVINLGDTPLTSLTIRSANLPVGTYRVKSLLGTDYEGQVEATDLGTKRELKLSINIAAQENMVLQLMPVK